MDAYVLEQEANMPNEEIIKNWLVTRVATTINSNQDDIDVTIPFSYYGLDSVAALGLSGDLEVWLGRNLPPTLTWDYPTIELLAEYLAKS